MAELNISKKKLWLFRLILFIIFPLLTIFILELSLNLAGYGKNFDPGLIKTYKNKKYVINNQTYTSKFFPPAIARHTDPFMFPVKKGRALRIFVCGGSAAQGVPESAFSLSRFLDRILRKNFPKKEFEVINIAATAINSHVVLDQIRFFSQFSPDLFIIYMGNNEVVGPFGSGSVFNKFSGSVNLIRAGLKIKSSGTGQLIKSFIKKKSSQPLVWRGLEMFLDQQVRKESRELKATYSNFKNNLQDIRDICSESELGVLISTVAVNYRESAPFASCNKKDLTSQDLEKWQELFKRGSDLLRSEKYSEAEACFTKALDIDNTHAELLYKSAVCLLNLKNYDTADKLFKAALDADSLRFRCDTKINSIIRDLAKNRAEEKIWFSDMESVFFKYKKDYPDRTLFHEHVHFTAFGNYLAAENLMVKLRSIIPGYRQSDSLPYDFKKISEELCFNDYEKNEIQGDVLELYLKKPPYTNRFNNMEVLNKKRDEFNTLYKRIDADYIDEIDKRYTDTIKTFPDDHCLRERYMKFLFTVKSDYNSAYTQASEIIRFLPFSDHAYNNAAYMLHRMGELKKAADMNKKVLQINPYRSDTLNNLGDIYMQLEDYTKSEDYFRKNIALHPGAKKSYANLARLLHMQGRTKEALKICKRGIKINPESTIILYIYAGIMEERGKIKEAAEIYRKIIKIDSSFTPALKKLKTLGSVL